MFFTCFTCYSWRMNSWHPAFLCYLSDCALLIFGTFFFSLCLLGIFEILPVWLFSTSLVLSFLRLFLLPVSCSAGLKKIDENEGTSSWHLLFNWLISMIVGKKSPHILIILVGVSTKQGASFSHEWKGVLGKGRKAWVFWGGRSRKEKSEHGSV